MKPRSFLSSSSSTLKPPVSTYVSIGLDREPAPRRGLRAIAFPLVRALAVSALLIPPVASAFGTVPVGSTGVPMPVVLYFASAATGVTVSVLTQGATGLDFADAGTGTCDTNGTSHSYSTGDSCTVNVTFSPKYAGSRYGAVNLLNGSGAVIASADIYGTGQGPQLAFGPAVVTALGGGFYYPEGVALDGSGNAYVIEEDQYWTVAKIPYGCTSASCVIDLFQLGPGAYVTGIAADGAGNLYVSSSTYGVGEVPAGCSSGTCLIWLGGNFFASGGGNSGALAVAVDGAGDVYVSPGGGLPGGAVAEVLEMPPGCVSSSCVNVIASSFGGQPLTGVAVDGSGNVYGAEEDSGIVEKWPPGCTFSPGCPATVFPAAPPKGVALDGAGNVYISTTNNQLMWIPSQCFSGSCTITTLASNFDLPNGMAVDGAGNVYVADYFNSAVKEVSGPTPPSLTFASTNVGSQSSDSPQTVLLRNIGNETLNFPQSPNVSASFTLDGSATCSSSSAGTLAAGTTCNLALDFIPTTRGPITGTVVLTDNDLNANPAVTQSIVVRGTATAPALITPTVTVTPNPSSINSAQSMSVGVTVTGGAGNPIPTGSVSLSSGSYTATLTLGSGSTSFTISAGSLPVGNDTLTGTYTPDSGSSSIYNSATGSVPVTVSHAIGSCTTPNPNPNPNPESFAAQGDFNGDCKSDILWQNGPSGGDLNEWLMNGTTATSSGSPGSAGSPPWFIQGIGDFNGNGQADVLWQNATTGEVYIWLIKGTSVTSSGSLGAVASEWNIVGVGDFDGDGKADILWKNSSTGQVYIWLMNGTTVASGGSPGTVASDWKVAGIGDFDGNGKADILWQNSSTGQIYIFLMNGTTVASGGSPGSVTPSSGWAIQGVGDFDANGKSDILWQNTTSGQVDIWLMNGTTVTRDGSPGTVASGWKIAGVGDYDGDGKTDILWQNSTSGQVYIWLMNGTAVTSGGSPGSVAPSSGWQIIPLSQ